jgi:uncharacterized protein
MLYIMGTVGLDTRPFNADEMSRSAGADIASKAIMGALQGKEFMGEGDEEITLSGQLLPTKIGGLNELEIVTKMMKTGTRFPLHRGDGKRMGWFALTKVSESHSQLMRNGVGFVVKYSVTMTKVQADAGSGQQIIAGLLSLFGGR